MKTVLSLVGTAGVDIDGADGEAKTGLYWAAFGGHLGVVEFLVGKGAVVDKATTDGWWTPVRVAEKKLGTAAPGDEAQKYRQIVALLKR